MNLSNGEFSPLTNHDVFTMTENCTCVGSSIYATSVTCARGTGLCTKYNLYTNTIGYRLNIMLYYFNPNVYVFCL